MKKTTLIFSAMLMTTVLAAQDRPILPPCIIASAALNLSGMASTDAAFSVDANPGFSVGAEYRMDGDFFLQGGLHFVSMNPTLTDIASDKSDKVNLQFFQVPLMAGLQIVKSEDSKQAFHVLIGGSFGTAVGVTDNTLGITLDDIKTFNYNFKIGVGGDFGKFVANIYYNRVLSHLYDTPGYNNRSRLMCWEFSLGYKFEFQRPGAE
jgi:hypothetical protein